MTTGLDFLIDVYHGMDKRTKIARRLRDKIFELGGEKNMSYASIVRLL
jgi:hypothetical protein